MKRSTSSTRSKRSPKQPRNTTSTSAARAIKRSSASEKRVLEISTDPADYVNSVWFDIEPTMADAMAMNVRSYLMMHLQKLLRDRGWTQRRAADELGVSQPRICQLVGNRLDRFSTDSLIVLLARAGVDVQIRAKPRSTSRAAKRAS